MRRHWQCHVKLTSTDERAGEHFQVKEVEGQQKFAPHSKNIPRPFHPTTPPPSSTCSNLCRCHATSPTVYIDLITIKREGELCYQCNLCSRHNKSIRYLLSFVTVFTSDILLQSCICHTINLSSLIQCIKCSHTMRSNSERRKVSYTLQT